jgi:error-prone DNA polymerase
VPVLERTLGVPLFQEQLLKMAMICANFTGGEAEELRRALGHKRSKQKMKDIEVRLRAGMTQNGVLPKAQDNIVQFISSFALYGFPESHSASFALIAYASAFLKVRYLAAFTAALLNNWPMGFYSPATITKDAARHGLKVKPIDVTCSNWGCSLEGEIGKPVLRIGLRYVRGLQRTAAEALLEARQYRPFGSTEELARRVPQLSHANLTMLASIGALNWISDTKFHRRDALWQNRPASSGNYRGGCSIAAITYGRRGKIGCRLPRHGNDYRAASDGVQAIRDAKSEHQVGCRVKRDGQRQEGYGCRLRDYQTTPGHCERSNLSHARR